MSQDFLNNLHIQKIRLHKHVYAREVKCWQPLCEYLSRVKGFQTIQKFDFLSTYLRHICALLFKLTIGLCSLFGSLCRFVFCLYKTGLSSLGYTTRKFYHFGGVLYGTNESHVQLWSACNVNGILERT